MVDSGQNALNVHKMVQEEPPREALKERGKPGEPSWEPEDAKGEPASARIVSLFDRLAIANRSRYSCD